MNKDEAFEAWTKAKEEVVKAEAAYMDAEEGMKEEWQQARRSRDAAWKTAEEAYEVWRGLAQ
jgi:hypothetical protein